MACVDICNDDSVNVTGSKSEFIVFIESYGQLKPREILIKALNVFDEKLDELAKKMKEGEESKISKITEKIKIKKKAA